MTEKGIRGRHPGFPCPASGKGNALRIIKSNAITPITIVLGLLALAGVAGCGRDREEGPQDHAAASPSSQPAVGTLVGQTAPDFRLATLQGTQLRLADLRGKAVLVDFWDTWCPPCRRAMPHLQQLSTQYPDQLVVVGIALGQEGEPKVRAFASERGLTFPVALGGEEIFKSYGVQNLPTTFLVDGQGTIRKKWVGGYDKSEYETAVRSVIAN
jgi:peroxiredoxin